MSNVTVSNTVTNVATLTAAQVFTTIGGAAGTATANLALVPGASQNIDQLGLPVGGLKIGPSTTETPITCSGAEINVLTAVTPGTAKASGALVLDASGFIDVLKPKSVVAGDSSLDVNGLNSTTGGSITVTGGTSSVSGTAGGAVSLVGGTPGATGIGGAVNLTGATAVANTGGGVVLTGGTGGTASTGGAVTLNGGPSGTSGTGGATTLIAGAGGTTGVGGAVTITTGAGGSTSGASGNMALASGVTTANSTNTSGTVTIKSGLGSNSTLTTAGGASGAATIGTANGGTTATGTAGAAGLVTVLGGNGGAATGAGTGGAGGNIVLTPGSGGTSSGGTAGVDGAVYVNGLAAKKQTVAGKTTTVTLTAAEIMGGILTANQGGGAVATYTMPLGTDLAAALPANFAAGYTFDFAITNISTNAAEIATVAGNTGTTAKGCMTVGANSGTTVHSFGLFRVVNTGAGTFDFYRIG